MVKNKMLLALTLLVAAATHGLASLWDTFDQCVAKYGKPIHVSDDDSAFSGFLPWCASGLDGIIP